MNYSLYHLFRAFLCRVCILQSLFRLCQSISKPPKFLVRSYHVGGFLLSDHDVTLTVVSNRSCVAPIIDEEDLICISFYCLKYRVHKYSINGAIRCLVSVLAHPNTMPLWNLSKAIQSDMTFSSLTAWWTAERKYHMKMWKWSKKAFSKGHLSLKLAVKL